MGVLVASAHFRCCHVHEPLGLSALASWARRGGMAVPCIDPLLGLHVHRRLWHSVLGRWWLESSPADYRIAARLCRFGCRVSTDCRKPPDVVGSVSASYDSGCAAICDAEGTEELCFVLRSPLEYTVGDSV